MKKLITFVFAIFLSLSVFSQSADVITDILETEKVTFGQVCYLSAVHLNLIEENESYEKAVSVLNDKKIISVKKDATQPVSAENVAYLFSKLWPIKGGLMFRLTKGSPRYAFKQFQADRIFSSAVDPSSSISGEKALSVYSSCLKKYGNYDIGNLAAEE